MKQQETVNSCMQNTLESKTDVALTVFTFMTKSVVHYRKSKLHSPNLSVISYIV